MTVRPTAQTALHFGANVVSNEAPLLPEEGWRRFADGVVGATAANSFTAIWSSPAAKLK